MPTQSEKLRAVCEHHKLTSASASSKEMFKAVKKKFPDKSVEYAYSDLPYLFRSEFEKKLTPKAEVPAAAKAEVVATAKEVEIIPPGQPLHMKVDGANQKVDVAAPALNFHLAPASVSINPGNVSWAHTLQRSVMYSFIFFSGSMFGVLATLALFRKVI